MNELELKRLKELENEIKLCGEIYNCKEWENYMEYHKLNRLIKLKNK